MRKLFRSRESVHTPVREVPPPATATESLSATELDSAELGSSEHDAANLESAVDPIDEPISDDASDAFALPDPLPSELLAQRRGRLSRVFRPAPPETDQGDKALVEAAQRGDRAAFETIIQRHQRAIFGYLRARLLEPSDAEDLCQEVFLRSFVSRGRFDSSIMVRPWLIGIARNLLREHIRRHKRRKEVAWTELCLHLEQMVPLDDHADDDVLAHLPMCLSSLGQSARQALDLRYQARLRLSEIGSKLHRSEGAVKLLMFRARQALKSCLDRKVLGESA